jgi:hypothetical protein
MENVRFATRRAELFKVLEGQISAKSQQFLRGVLSTKMWVAHKSSHVLLVSIKIGPQPSLAQIIVASKFSDDEKIFLPCGI